MTGDVAGGEASAGIRLGLSRLHHPVTVLGHGTRVAVWFQGCSIRCRGCISRDTWAVAEEAEQVRVEDVLARIAQCGEIDGLTVSGGEPFDQPEALRALIIGFRGQTDPTQCDILVYSGYTATRLRRDHPDVWRLADAVVTGPYLQGRTGDPMRGSDNQEVHAHSALGRARYGAESVLQGGLQVVAAGGSLWMVGIPRMGDMLRLEQGLTARGVRLDDVSWRC